MSRPEHIAPPEIYYGDEEARKYSENSRIQAIQAEMAIRAIDLLELPADYPAHILDIGCGSGLSGECLDEDGHYWVGMDIAPSMLGIALDRQVDGDLLLSDIGDGVPFRPGSFDAAISISVLQWLCNADATINFPAARIHRFFSSLYACLKRGGRAVLQFYPENDAQSAMLMKSATQCGFGGGMVIDYPETQKKRKYYLCLVAGGGATMAQRATPKPLSGERPGPTKVRGVKGGKVEKPKAWIKRKKELYRKRGKDVPNDSKFTGRKRHTQF